MEKSFKQQERAARHNANQSHPLPQIARSSALGIQCKQVEILPLPIDGIAIPAELSGNLYSLVPEIWFA